MSSQRNELNRPSIAVYTIMRDEEAHVERWAQSAADADTLLVADTGSRDGTISRARELGVEVHRIHVEPFRYDVARNQALDRLPADIDVCVSLDADEILIPGWRAPLEDAWRQGATRVRCTIEWRWSDYQPPLRYTAARVHARHGYRWECPVHEQLVALGREIAIGAPIEIHHLRERSRPVGGNLELLRTGVAERPSDARMVHMLANEARMNGLQAEAIHFFHRALALPLCRNERLHSLLTLAHLEAEQHEAWTLQACAEFPERREPWFQLAQLHLSCRRWRAARAAAHRALAITEPADDYLANPMAWGPWPEQIAACAAQELGDSEWEAHHARLSRPGAGDLPDHAVGPRYGDQPLIDFVTVVFNDASAAERMEEQLRRHVRTPYSFTAIDNTTTNLGWAAACNDGAAHGDAQLIAFIDQDVELLDSWLEPVLAALEADPGLVIAGPRCLDGLAWPRVPVGLNNWVCGACMLVRRDFFASVGGFDTDRFPHEYAETDLERAAEARGYRVQTVEKSNVVHRVEHSKSEQVLAWRAQGARNQALKWGVPLDPWGVAHEKGAAARGDEVMTATRHARAVAAMIVGPNESFRYLERTLRLVQQWAQLIIVYAHRPDSDTWEMVRECASFSKRVDSQGFNESEVRNGLLGLCDGALEDGDIVVVIDADEELRALDGGSPVSTLGQLAVSRDPGPWTVEFWHLWTPDGTQRRVDGLWHPDIRHRVYRHRKGLRIPDRQLCCAPIPALPLRDDPPVLAIAHWGYACPDDVIRKHAYYMERDGGRFHDLRHLESIIKDPTLEPVPSRGDMAAATRL